MAAAARQCAGCPREFVPTRSDALYHSAACRLRAHRERHRDPQPESSAFDEFLAREVVAVDFLRDSGNPDACYDALHAVLFPEGFAAWARERQARREARRC